MKLSPREDERVCCDISVEDYQDLREKKKFLNIMRRISEIAVKADSELSK